jgi:AcrR family transcriptional regulator
MGRPARPDLHEALLEAARAEFASHGLERARVEDITRRAGASKGAFYLHFASKEEAFEEILQRFMGALEDQARGREEAEHCFRRDHASMDESELRPLQVEFDCRVDLALLETLWRNRQILALIESTAAGRYHRAVDEFRRRMQSYVTSRMAAKQAAGWIRRDADPAVMGDILVGTYEGFARRMFDLKERPDLEGWLRSFTDILYDGMLVRPLAAGCPSPSRRPPARAQAVRGRRSAPRLTPRSRKERR